MLCEDFFFNEKSTSHVLVCLSETWIIIITISHEIWPWVSNEASNLSHRSKRHLHIMPYAQLCCWNNGVQLQVRDRDWSPANQLSMGANKQTFREKAWAADLWVEPESNPVVEQRCFFQHTMPHPHDQVRWTAGHQVLCQIIFKLVSGYFL